MKYIVQEWENGYATSPTMQQVFDAPNDDAAIRRAKRELRTRGKWPYWVRGEELNNGMVFIAGWNLDPERCGERTRLGTLERFAD